MDVKLVARTLELFELFAAEGRPLSLTEMSRALSVPMSSTLGLVRTLVARGYLYEIRKRGGYYPTQRMSAHVARIQANDPLLHLLRPRLQQLRDDSGETVVFGKIQNDQVVYLDTLPSRQAIRYMVEPGDLRPVHANSIGKAILSAMDPKDRDAVLDVIEWTRYTGDTLAERSALTGYLAQAAAQGWADNRGESVADLWSVAMPIRVAEEWFGVSVVGPSPRMQPRMAAHVEKLAVAMADLKSALFSTS